MWLLEDSYYAYADGQRRQISDQIHFRKKSKVGMLLNVPEGTLAFYVDRRRLDHVFTRLPRMPLHAYVSMRVKGSKVQLDPSARCPG